jgi:hypothetical protein
MGEGEKGCGGIGEVRKQATYPQSLPQPPHMLYRYVNDDLKSGDFRSE